MPPKTSQSHPLRIDTVELEQGRLGLTFCPGKVQSGAMTGDWARDLKVDIESIRAAGFDAIVSVMEQHELVELQVPGLGAAVEEAGMEWLHLPIPDGGIPGTVEEAHWQDLSATVQRILAENGGVLIHCKGGLGRTGTIAARVLMALGDSAANAIARVRSARSGSIEQNQEHYLLSLPGASP